VLIVMALASLVVAASLLLAQRDYKRMLAYSSIEHLGLVALGAAVGSPLALAAALLHVLGHGLAKGVLFLGAGRMLQTTGTSSIDGVRGLAARQPTLAGCFGFGVLALIGLPPFSVFASEFGIARSGFEAGLGWVTAAALILVLVIAAALIGHTSRMLLGTPPDGPGAATAVRPLPITVAITLVGGLVAAAALGITTGPLRSLLRLAADTLGVIS
jgi:hydrogenase-4 component F